jgi:O-antigen biosynthesis protein
VPNVAYLVDALPPRVFGGTPLVAWDYARTVAERGWDVSVITPVEEVTSWPDTTLAARPGEPFVRYEVPPTAAQGIAWALEAASSPAEPEALQWFARFLSARRPDVLHVISNVNSPLAWPALAQDLGVPVVRSVTGPEDLCGLGHPTSPRAEAAGYCEAPLTPPRCASCVVSVFRPSPTELLVPGLPSSAAYPTTAAERHAHWTAQLSRKRTQAAHDFGAVFDRVIFSTASFRSYFERTLPLSPARVRVIQMGLPAADPHPAPQPRRADQPVRFAALGHVHPTKGVAALVEALAHPALMERHDRYRLDIHGGGDLDLLRPLLHANPSVSAAGPYRPDELPVLLAGADVGLSVSRFETAHRVTREYLQAGVPVIGSRAFGIPEVVVHGRNGLLFDHAEPGSLRRALLAVIDDRGLLDRLAAGAASSTVRTLDQEIDEVLDTYAEVQVVTRRQRARSGPKRPGSGAAVDGPLAEQ